MQRHRFCFTTWFVLGFLTSLPGQPVKGEPPSADAIYQATGVQGGLVVHLGCGTGKLTAALHANTRYLVHGLDTNADAIELARDSLQAKGLYGPVSVDTYDGRHLPYVSESVNLVVASDLDDVPVAEVHRVLAPEGTAYVQQADGWQMTVKPRPTEIDEWTHFLHDASGNAVANDSRIGSPKSLRWVAGPRWCRSHETPSSVNAVVVAGGRIFTIFDEGPTGTYVNLPQKCQLIARDAANGVLLWKVPMRGWQPEFGTGTGNRWNIHHTIPRRLIANGDHVYVTLGFLDSPVSVLHAATGKLITSALEGTRGTDEMLLSDGRLIVKTTKERSVAATARIGKASLNDTLAAVNVATGKQLWQKENVRVVPYAFSALDGRIVYHNLEELVCLDATSGRDVWRVPNRIASTLGGESNLVIRDGVVLFHGRGAAAPKSDGKKGKVGFQLTAVALDDGTPLWQTRAQSGQAGACTQPTDLFVAKGTVWCGGSLKGLDLHTGEVVKTLSIGKTVSPGHHYRCHRSKATEQFLIWPKRGAEFLDLEGDNHMRNDWLRAPCFTGATPANGLFYVPPSQCFCYPGAKVFGFLAMSAAPPETLKSASDANLEKGPSYGTPLSAPAAVASDWPMYRRDIRRSGSTQTTVPTDLDQKWLVELGCRATQAVIVGDRLWIVEKDMHRIRCLDATNGNDVWTYTAGGRIDSAPTVQGGRVFFGCRDGSAYCLRATDGALIWRFRAAPADRRVVSFGHVESLWPIQGSVLVQNDVVYFAAGRSSFLDGGMFVYGLDVKTGRVVHSHHLEGPWPDVMKDEGTPFAMEGALPDLFVSDGKDLYMQRIKFDAKLNRLPTIQESSLGELDMGANHLVATGGFLDDTGFDRVYWMHGRRWPGFYFAQQSPKAGQLVVFDDSTTYAVKYFYRRIQWSPAFFPGEQGYLLFADDNDNEPVLEEKDGSVKTISWLPEGAATDKHRRGGRGVEKGTGYCRAKPAKWQKMIPLRIRAMLLAGDTLYAAGTPDVLDPEDPLAAFEGRAGSELHVYSTKDGALIATYDLPSEPVFDGMSAAAGGLFLSMHDGQLLCLGEATK